MGKSRGEWVVLLARTGMRRNAQKMLAEKSEGKMSLGRTAHTWMDVTTDLKSDTKVQPEFIRFKTETL